ncbi:MAG: class I SAM-dependent rRNA methyltransferase [Erysipelotrichaceae bacterium]|nr:class I SAM-dependent rRNA methyltransferase [Erysipelotrichaceae bacterium]
MIRITLKKNEGRTISAGGLWIFDNEIDKIDGTYENGDIVEVVSFKDDFIGYGYINDNSKIRIRILTRNRNDKIDRDFFMKRFSDAWNYRKSVVDTDCCRIVFSDSDRLPGLIVDKFNDILVFEVDTLGMNVRKEMLAECLKEVLENDGVKIRGIYERSDARVRTLEGLERVKGFLSEPFETLIEVEENGVKLKVNIAEGQKTGYFLDQKYNHLAIRKLCEGKKVLDCCTHTGGFALSAALVAEKVTGIDASELAIEQARENSELNGFTNTEFIVADVFDYLIEEERKKAKYDVIILDPPAFTKSKNSVKNASKGYKEINYRAMKLLNPGGFLVTCSCSEYMPRDLFMKIILSAANDSHKRLRLVESRAQAPDHPIIMGSNVSDYLKCIIVQVNNR